MNTHADHTSANKSDAVANSLQKQEPGTDGFQFEDERPEAVAQRKMLDTIHESPRAMQLLAYQSMADNSTRTKQLMVYQEMADGSISQTAQRKEDGSGLPGNLKTGIESLSGMSMDGVNVHRNSDKPAQLQAHAYAQGKDIHLGPGQEKHLPHEAWHVVQQMQGRVRPTLQMKSGIQVNDDGNLEQEADTMGQKALQMQGFRNYTNPATSTFSNHSVAQRVVNWADVKIKKTATNNYGVKEDNKMLYSKTTAPDPEPPGLYIKGADTTNTGMRLNTWLPNVRFLSGDMISQGKEEEAEGEPVAEEKKETKVEANKRITDTLIRESTRIKTEVKAAMDRRAGSPTMGIVGQNDCGMWAVTLQSLIAKARAIAPADGERKPFDFGDAPDAKMDAPELEVGSTMIQQLTGGGSGHHGATVVARDGTSVVTLEAHVEKKLEAPQFHTYEGLPGFIDANNEGKEGPNQYLKKNGRKGHLTQLGAPEVAAFEESRLSNLSEAAGRLKSKDPVERLSGMQDTLKWYEEVKPDKACFLTTACVNYRNLADDCEELTVLRDFRDNYMRKLPAGESLIKVYYEAAPGIVMGINRSPRRRDIYEELYGILRKCVDAIKAGKNAVALQVYMEMVLKLHHEFQ